MIPLFYLPLQRERAQTLASWCQLLEIETSALTELIMSSRSQAALVLDELGLGLLMPGYQSLYRLPRQRMQRRGRLSELAKACGLPQGHRRILDACAGFGADGMTLAALGCTVTMVEQNTLVWLLLRDLDQALGRVTVESGDGMDFMGEPHCWDVIYLDPMFPPRRKTALPNRGLQHLRELSAEQALDVGETLPELIHMGRRCALARVVVKRRLKDPQDAQAAFQIKGKSIRFDVYLPE